MHMGKTLKHSAIILLLLVLIAPFLSGSRNGLVAKADDHTINVSGRFTYAGGVPVRDAIVRIYDNDVWPNPDDLKATGRTDENGYYEFIGVDNVDFTVAGDEYYGIDVYAKVYAENEHVRLRSNPAWLSGDVYSFKSDKRDDVDNGATVDFGTTDAEGDMNEAFSMFDKLCRGTDFIAAVIQDDDYLNWPPPQVNAFWHDWFTDDDKPGYCLPKSIPYRYSVHGNWWWFALIDMATLEALDMTLEAALTSIVGIHEPNDNQQDDNYGGWDEAGILHELGHWIFDKYAEMWKPDTETDHYDYYAYTPGHAYVEGWAHFFSAAARSWMGRSSQYYDPFDIEENNEFPDENGNPQGNSVERAVACTFWDLYDASNEAGDTVTLGMGPIWDVVENYDPDPNHSWDITGDTNGKDHPWNMYDFFMGLLARHPDVISGVPAVYRLHGIVVDDVPPTTTLTIGMPSFVSSGNTYVSPSTTFSLSAQDNEGGTGVKSSFYRVYNGTYDTNWLEYSAPFYLSSSLSDGVYSIDYRSTDNFENTESTNTATVILDNTPPATAIAVGDPKYVSETTYVTLDTYFTLDAADAGSGVKSSAYRVYSTTYDSGWQTYTAPFQLTSLPEGNYTIEYRSTDNVDNVETAKSITVTLFYWDYIYEDTFDRGTTFKINLDYSFIQFIAPDKDFNIKKANSIETRGKTAIVIRHEDSQLRLESANIDTGFDLCIVAARDLQTQRQYQLVDRPGVE